MSKRKIEIIDDTNDDIKNLVSELENANRELKNIVNNEDDSDKVIIESKDENNDTDRKRSELIQLAEDGDLDQSIAYIKKASSKIINKLYHEYEERRLQKANEFFTDLVISTFSSLLGGLDVIQDPKQMEDELSRDKLLRRGVQGIISSITPFLQYNGLLSGSITVGRHASYHM